MHDNKILKKNNLFELEFIQIFILFLYLPKLSRKSFHTKIKIIFYQFTHQYYNQQYHTLNYKT